MLAGNDVRLVDDEGHPVPVGTPGEVLTMGPELCLGYLDPSHNAAAFGTDGWMATGDIGILDADGFLGIVDRKKDIIIRGGENISSKEVEDILCRHPAVAEAATVAWPDVKYGERPGVFVRLNPGETITLDDIREHFATTGILKQKPPERLVLVDEFPRTPAGMILRPALRKRVAEMLEGERQTS
jgi:cyclohexanecarboxylate-CoA ligase